MASVDYDGWIIRALPADQHVYVRPNQSPRRIQAARTRNSPWHACSAG